MRTCVSWICAFVSLVLWSAAQAAAPPLLPLQGVLTDADGVPLNAAVSVRFSLHTAETAGTELWYETQSITPVDGLFAAYLGQGTGSAMTLATFRDRGELWLEVKVGDDDPMARVRLASVAYAGFAEYCGNVPQHSHPAADLPAGVVIGAQTCSGSDKVRGVASTGALVCAPDLGTGADTLGQLNCNSGETVKWNGSVWACAVDNNTGTITAVSAGDGLSGNTVGTVATLSLSSACSATEVLRYSGSAWQCSPAVQAIATPAAGGLAFTTTGATYNLMLKAGCANGQVLKYNTGTSSWDCAGDANSGGDITDVLVGTGGGLAVTSPGGPQPTLSLMPCPVTGQVLKYTVGTGWDCAADDNAGGDITAVNTPNGGGLIGGATTGAANLTLMSCSANQKLRSSGAAWACSDDLLAVNTPATGGLTGGGSSGTLSVGLKPCTAGQVLKSVGSGWDCGADNNSLGTVTSVATGAGLAGGPITTTGTISIANAGVTNAMLANSSLTVSAGTGLTGGGLVALGGSTSLSIGAGGVTNAMLLNDDLTLNAGAGLAGGGVVALGGSTTISIANAGVTNAMLANSDLTVTAGAGLTGGGSVALGAATSLALDPSHANTWTGLQQFQDSIVVFQTGDPTQTVALWGGAAAGELVVNGNRALRLEATGNTPNVIGGSAGNGVTAGAVGATIGGGGATGAGNTVTDDFGTVAGGYRNQAGDGAGGTSDRGYAAVGGGLLNVAMGQYATVPGGGYNTASGLGSTVAGGSFNAAAGMYSFTAGFRAKANEQGCFVWGDASDYDVTCDTINQFLVRATGGAKILTGTTTGVELAAGGGSWTSLSDRNLKQDVTAVDPREVLRKVADMPVATWRYRTEASGARHMGPMAQDFHAAFGLGDSDRSITTVDADGVALAAIQGLHRTDGDLRADNQQLRAQLRGLEQRVAQLEQARPARAGARDFGWGALGLLVVGGVVVARRRRGQ